MQWAMPFAISLVFLNLSYVGSAVRSIKLKQDGAKYEGMFDSFLKKFLFLLSGGREKPVRKICTIFRNHLKSMDKQYTSELANKFKELSRMYQDGIASELTEYQNALEDKSDKLIAFLKAINAAFTLQQQIQFNDYLYDMENYIRGDKRNINTETRKLLNDVILKSILSMSKRDRVDLKKKLRSVIKEHEDFSDKVKDSSSSESSSSAEW